MKKLLFALILLLACGAYAQEAPTAQRFNIDNDTTIVSKKNNIRVPGRFFMGAINADSIAASLRYARKVAGDSASTYTANRANWNTAYGWGNHASAGYLTTTAIQAIWDSAHLRIAYDSSQHDYLRSNEDLDPDQLAGDATNNDKVDSNLIGVISRAKLADSAATVGIIPATRLDTTGVTNNYVIKKTSGGITWAAQDVLNDFTDIYGSLTVHGALSLVNYGSYPDINSAFANHGDTNFYKGAMLPPYMRTGSDSLTFVHPSGYYDPNSTLGYKYILTFTGARGTDIIEEPFLRVSNDGETWLRYTDGVNTCPDTLWTLSEFPDTLQWWNGTVLWPVYTSDNELIHGHDGKAHLYLRCSATQDTTDAEPATDASSIWHKESSDLITWSSPTMVVDWYRGFGDDDELMSPCVFLGANQTYVMLVVDSKIQGGGTPDTMSVIRRYTSVAPDSGWALQDTVRDSTGAAIIFGKNSENRLEFDSWAWHIDVVDWGPDAKVILMTGGNKSDTMRYDMFIGLTRDDFKTMTFRYEALLRSAGHDASYAPSSMAWDEKYIYKATGWRLDKGNRDIIEMPYSAFSDGVFRSGIGSVEFLSPASLDFNEVAGRRNPPTDSMILTFPNWADSNGVMDRWVDSTSKGSGSGSTVVDYIMMRATCARPFVLDTLILSNLITTDSGTGRSGAVSSYCGIDSIALMGPDFSSGTNAADSVWWASGNNRDASSRTTIKVALRLHQMAPAGSVFKLVFKNTLAAAKSAIHMERVAIKGRSR